MAAAVAALDGFDGEGEPAGWERHPPTGRYRDEGDPAREYVHDPLTGERVYAPPP